MRKSDCEGTFHSALKGQLNPVIILSVKPCWPDVPFGLHRSSELCNPQNAVIFDAFGSSDLIGNEQRCGTQRPVEVSGF